MQMARQAALMLNMTAPELAKHFEVSVRTIYRDIDILSAAGISVYTVLFYSRSMVSVDDSDDDIFTPSAVQGGTVHTLVDENPRRKSQQRHHAPA